MATEREAMAIERQAWVTEREALREALAIERELIHNAERQLRENEPDIVTSITLKEFFSYILHTYYSL